MTATTFPTGRSIGLLLRSGRHQGLSPQPRLRAAQRKHLLSLDDHMLRDMGLTRLDVLHGDF